MRYSKKDLLIVASVSLAFFTVAWAGLEIGLTFFRPSPYVYDELLGWRNKENFQGKFPQKTFGGKDYVVSFSTDGKGLRHFGSRADAPIKILVLGDSYTADPYASDDRMWYGAMIERIAQRSHRPQADFYVQAGGSGGWGTYQELLYAEQLAQSAHPNLFVLQFCSNDFQNNTYEWEKESIVRGQYLRRPFATLDSQTPKYVPGLLGQLFRSFVGRSRLFNRIDAFIEAMQFRTYGGYIGPLPADLTEQYERDSIALTKMLLVRLRNLYRDVPAVMVNCDGNEAGPNKFWKNVAQDAGFIPLAGPSDFLRALKPDERKQFLHADQGHMSEEGNRAYGLIAGDAIASLGLAALN